MKLSFRNLSRMFATIALLSALTSTAHAVMPTGTDPEPPPPQSGVYMEVALYVAGLL